MLRILKDYSIIIRDLEKILKKFEEKILTGTSTNFFYNTIAPQYIKEVEHELSYTYFDIKDYEKILETIIKKMIKN